MERAARKKNRTIIIIAAVFAVVLSALTFMLGWNMGLTDKKHEDMIRISSYSLGYRFGYSDALQKLPPQFGDGEILPSPGYGV